MREIKETAGRSLVVGKLPRGCELCMEGAKLVLFVTGLCPRRCFYCPLSEKRRWKDVIFANELEVRKDEDIIKEARLMNALGAGITGGDPLIKPKRTIRYIKLLKETFGPSFHLHLYTSGITVTKRLLRELSEAGLDEIRFHPSKSDWKKIEWALDTDMDVGAEIPAIPGKADEIKVFAKYLDDIGASFLNLNELEFSETNAQELRKRNIKPKSGTLAAAEGSEETALNVLKWAARNLKITVHYCPSSLKDSVQLKNRLLRRAKIVAKPYEEITEEGLLVKGIIQLPNKGLNDLKRLKLILIRRYGIPQKLLHIDEKNMVIETTWYVVEKLSKELKSRFNAEIGIVEEYPTADRVRISYTPL
ncbi:MAG TPA: radical SAM protein [Candidatus Desulfofervidus auxilii]|uniref:Radical SAM protein n=1 Tax=Desulfofervidus auxilii TaxID=1621989 RepID=A0A7C0Y9S7_DESA2|nr:radical SAM protein [Candidatus Desulfofervidus auxilii]